MSLSESWCEELLSVSGHLDSSEPMVKPATPGRFFLSLSKTYGGWLLPIAKWRLGKLRRAFRFPALLAVVSASACSNSDQSNLPASTRSKFSSLLLLQIALRQDQLASPTPERLAQMQAQGMNTINLNVHRIYLYLRQQLTAKQIDELQALGIKVYSGSWIPPVGNHPQGFYLADMPIAQLHALASKDYILKLDTAETPMHLQSEASEGELR